jgi:hypothetical protein
MIGRDEREGVSQRDLLKEATSFHYVSHLYLSFGALHEQPRWISTDAKTARRVIA